MKRNKKKKNKPSPRQTYRAVSHKMRNFRTHKIDPDFKEQFKSEWRQLRIDFIEGNISLRQIEEKANDLIKKFPKLTPSKCFKNPETRSTVRKRYYKV